VFKCLPRYVSMFKPLPVSLAVTSFTCQFCTTTLTILAALSLLEFTVARFCYLTLK
jgi:hypothetical protein